MTTKIFENGRSHAVRLPKEYRFDADEIYIQKIGSLVILAPKEERYAGMLEGLKLFTEELFSEDREQPFPEKRDLL